MRLRHLFALLVLFGIGVGILSGRAWREEASESVGFAPLAAPAFAPLDVPTGTASLAGVVLEEDGRPAGGVEVFLYREQPLAEGAEPLSWTLTDADGRFSLEHLVPARYGAALVRSGHPPISIAVEVPASEPVRWTIPPRLAPLRALPEIERAALAGRVAPGPGRGADSFAGYEVVLRPAADTPSLSGVVQRRVAVDASGAFLVEGLVRARYVAELLPPWATGGSWPVLARAELDHRAAAAGEFVLAPELGSLSGAVVDQQGRALEGALVTVAAIGHLDRLWPVAQTDAAGGFVLADLPPGRYDLRVRAGAALHQQEVELRGSGVTEIEIEPLDLEELAAQR